MSDRLGRQRLLLAPEKAGLMDSPLTNLDAFMWRITAPEKSFRFDPRSEEVTMIAEGMTGVASLVFGEGNFDRTAIYATSTRRGAGKIWKVPVGVRGAPLHR